MNATGHADVAGARDAVLAAVRRSLGREPAGPPSSPAPVPRDYRVGTDVVAGSSAALALLHERLDDYRATVVRTTPAALAQSISDELAGAASVVVPPGLPRAWTTELHGTGTAVVADQPDSPLTADRLDQCHAVLTACALAVAETGTLVLDGGPGQGRRVLTLLPDRHVCVVRQDQVVGSVPEAVRLLEARPERPLTWISGPSATSDIELVRVEGVHGPRDLRVILVSGK